MTTRRSRSYAGVVERLVCGGCHTRAVSGQVPRLAAYWQHGHVTTATFASSREAQDDYTNVTELNNKLEQEGIEATGHKKALFHKYLATEF